VHLLRPVHLLHFTGRYVCWQRLLWRRTPHTNQEEDQHQRWCWWITMRTVGRSMHRRGCRRADKRYGWRYSLLGGNFGPSRRPACQNQLHAAVATAMAASSAEKLAATSPTLRHLHPPPVAHAATRTLFMGRNTMLAANAEAHKPTGHPRKPLAQCLRLGHNTTQRPDGDGQRSFHKQPSSRR
jgi:hypothetical protein